MKKFINVLLFTLSLVNGSKWGQSPFICDTINNMELNGVSHPFIWSKINGVSHHLFVIQ